MEENECWTDLNAIFEYSPQMLCLLNARGHFLKANKFLSQILGYTEEQLLSQSFIDFVHPEDQDNALRQFETLLQQKSLQLQTRFCCADGLYKSFSWHIGVLPDLTYYTSATEITDLLNVQNQLVTALTDIQKLYDNSLDVLCAFDVEGRFTRVSKASKLIWGYEEHELLGRKYLDFVHPDDVDLAITVDAEIRSGINKSHFENRYIHKNGSIVHIIWSAHYIPSEQSVFATAHDAKEIEKQKEILYLNNSRFEALLKSGNDIICIIGADETYKYVSPSAKHALHFEPEFFIGKRTFDFIHPDDVSRIATAFEYVLTTDEHVHVAPFRFKKASGDWCWLDSYCTNRIDDPAIQGIVINARDITTKINDEQEKRQSAKKLKLSNERYELVAKATKDIIWDWDLENNHLSRGKGFGKILGFSLYEDNKVYTPWDEHIYPEDKSQVLQSIVAATDNPDEKFWQDEYRYIRADGSVAFIIDQGYIVRDANKKAIRMVGAMHDMTEVKEKELRISEQKEQLNQIAKMNSHLIRKPVANILGLIEVLDKKSITGKVNLEILELIRFSTKELDDVIKQINKKTSD